MIGLRGPSAKGVRAAGDQPASAGEREKNKKSPRQGADQANNPSSSTVAAAVFWATRRRSSYGTGAGVVFCWN